MTVPKDSPAVQIARAQVKAWSNHDLAAARAAGAGNAALAGTTTQAEAPAVNTVGNKTGIAGDMAGGQKIIDAVVAGGVRRKQATGGVGGGGEGGGWVGGGGDGGSGKVASPTPRLYLLDEDHKITAEQVVYFVTSR